MFIICFAKLHYSSTFLKRMKLFFWAVLFEKCARINVSERKRYFHPHPHPCAICPLQKYNFSLYINKVNSFSLCRFFHFFAYTFSASCICFSFFIFSFYFSFPIHRFFFLIPLFLSHFTLPFFQIATSLPAFKFHLYTYTFLWEGRLTVMSPRSQGSRRRDLVRHRSLADAPLAGEDLRPEHSPGVGHLPGEHQEKGR